LQPRLDGYGVSLVDRGWRVPLWIDFGV